MAKNPKVEFSNAPLNSSVETNPLLAGFGKASGSGQTMSFKLTNGS